MEYLLVVRQLQPLMVLLSQDFGALDLVLIYATYILQGRAVSAFYRFFFFLMAWDMCAFFNWRDYLM